MGKNDFDIDFDFDDDFNFDPKAFLESEEFDTDIDLSAFSDEELGLTPEQPAESGDPSEFASDLDLHDFDLDADLDLDSLLEKEDEAVADADSFEDDGLFEDEELPDDIDLSEEDLVSEPEVQEDPQPEETDMDETMEYPEEMDQLEFDEALDDAEESKPAKAPRRKAQPRQKKEFKLPKLPTPNIFTKFYDLYFAPLLNKDYLQEEPVDPNNPRRRRRKKSKAQIFKEVYLPPILVFLCVVLMLSFVIGSISNAIDRKQIKDAYKASEEVAASNAAAQLEQEYQALMAQAEVLAAGYNYDDAVTLLDTFSGTMTDYPDMVAKRSEYVSAKGQLVEYSDFSRIPNLSFHVLIADPSRAFADGELGGLYNRNFVTTDEFSKILDQLYANGYVLVDFDSFTSIQSADGNEQMFPDSVYLPEGKKPIMITETMVNYFEYMVDSNSDGVADAGGDGFASKLVVDPNGDIKAEYVDVNNVTNVGNYDLVPILEDFIEAHPDFSYRGARAILAVTGSEGIFGYRCNTSYIGTRGQDYYDQQKAGAIEIVNALREKGYTLACFTYANGTYGNMNSALITADLQNWTSEITPIIGQVDTFVFAKESDLPDYTGTSFKSMYQAGFRYFISNNKEPSTQINNTYLKQNRLMVTGNTMYWSSDRFSSYFNCNSVLDLTARGGSVPNG